MLELKNKINTSPFLRWTGSKRWFVNQYLKDFLPEKFNNYHEPFLGGGAVFFHLKNNFDSITRKFYLSDTNSDLINCYSQVKNNPTPVIEHLKRMRNTSCFYYNIRNTTPRSNEKKAAKFIYLNKTSFNGIYRVNSNGEYNVPYGRRKNVDFISANKLIEVNQQLQDVIIKNQNFQDAISNVKSGDLVFLDPPYTVAHENNGFIEYNQKLFSWKDQVFLRNIIEEIDNKGAYFILTNAKHKSILELYKYTGKIKSLSRYSQIGGRAKTRGIFNEVVIYNTK